MATPPALIQRRQVLAGILISAAGGCDRSATPALLQAAPEKIRLIPDGSDIPYAGRLSDGRLLRIDIQLDATSSSTRDFVCSFVFDGDGRLIDHSIELIGTRGSYPTGSVERATARHAAALGRLTTTDIWVRPFGVDREGVAFGLIPRQTEGGEWRVEAMPGNTLSFYPPWEAGEYDT